MQLFTEYPEPDEREYYDRTVQLVQQQMELLYGDATKADAKRDTHAKTHICVRGILEIFDFNETTIKIELAQKTALTPEQLDKIPLKQGLLAQAKQYPVWIRFANGSSKVKHDYEPDARSMSVKVMAVTGERLPESHEAQTQDIITQNAEIFFIKTIKDYYGFFLPL